MFSNKSVLSLNDDSIERFSPNVRSQSETAPKVGKVFWGCFYDRTGPKMQSLQRCGPKI